MISKVSMSRVIESIENEFFSMMDLLARSDKKNIAHNVIILGDVGIAKTAMTRKWLAATFGAKDNGTFNYTYMKVVYKISIIEVHSASFDGSSVSLPVPSLSDGSFDYRMVRQFDEYILVNKPDLLIVMMQDANKDMIGNGSFNKFLKSLLDRRINMTLIPPVLCICTGNNTGGSVDNMAFDDTTLSAAKVWQVTADDETIQYMCQEFLGAADFFKSSDGQEFIQYRDKLDPDHVASPRGWESGFHAIRIALQRGKSLKFAFEELAASVGERPADAFQHWYEVQNRRDDFSLIVSDPNRYALLVNGKVTFSQNELIEFCTKQNVPLKNLYLFAAELNDAKKFKFLLALLQHPAYIKTFSERKNEFATRILRMYELLSEVT